MVIVLLYYFMTSSEASREKPVYATLTMLGEYVASVGGVQYCSATDIKDYRIEGRPIDYEEAVWFSHKMEQILDELSYGNELQQYSEVHAGGVINYGKWSSLSDGAIEEAGISVEFGGPSLRGSKGYMLPGFKPDIVTNLAHQHSNGEVIPRGELQLLADAAKMPFADASIGSIHIAYLPGDYVHKSKGLVSATPLRNGAIYEAARVIKPGGYLVWDGGVKTDFDRIIGQGFEPVALSMDYSVSVLAEDVCLNPRFSVDGIFQKDWPAFFQ
jgi:hypothetical protein